MFRNCKNLEELKSLFRKLALRLHPDYGGTNELMIICKNTYEESVELLKEMEKIRKKDEDHKGSKQYYEKTFEDVEELDEKLNILPEMQEYSKNHPSFSLKFVNSVIDYLEEHGHITSSQYNSLVNIYYSFKMDKKNKDND